MGRVATVYESASAIASLALFVATAAFGQGGSTIGPSTGAAPYIVPSRDDVSTVSVLTVGDSVNNKPDGVAPYRMVGIPDGLGILDHGDQTFTLFMNHELAPAAGVPRRHHGLDPSGRGAFVSQWRIAGAGHPTLAPLTVLEGRDLIQTVRIFDIATRSYRAPVPNPIAGSGEDDLNRLCSADLPAVSAFASNGLGTTDRIFMNGEESGSENGRAFAHVVSGAQAGTTFELPRLGDAAWENVVANPFAQPLTIVMLNDDRSPAGQVYMYVGTKLDAAANAGATPVDLAGLNNGELFGIAVSGFASEPAAGIPNGTRFTTVSLGDVTALTGPQLDAQSNAGSVTRFARPEDGQWDPNNPRSYYFATTGQQGTASSIATRLWRLAFDDVTNPTQGGFIEMVLDGSEGIRNLDNITIDRAGNVYLQEDLGGVAELSRIWRYHIATDSLTEIAASSAQYFTSGSANFQTIDDETSGIIDASSVLGAGWFLATSQSHASAGDAELVQRGQLVAINVRTPTPVPSRLRNISTRGRVQTRDNVLIGGFFVTGQNQRRVVVRAIGPSLNASGVRLPGRLEDPTLELFDANGALIVANDNWQDSQETELAASGLAPAENAESAIVRLLDPGSYTAVVRGRNESTGLAVVEAYDLESSEGGKLANIATRGFVETGDNVLIGGFIVGAGDPGWNLRVVARAIGPTLAARGVPTPLQDPTLELFDSNGLRIAFNDNWRDAQQVEIEQTGLAPGDDREAAIAMTLPPGAYTTVVRGVSDTTGSGLVEIYNVPGVQSGTSAAP